MNDNIRYPYWAWVDDNNRHEPSWLETLLNVLGFNKWQVLFKLQFAYSIVFLFSICLCFENYSDLCRLQTVREAPRTFEHLPL